MLTMPLDAYTDITIPNAKCPKCKVDTGNKLIKLLVICLVSVLILTINSAKKTDSLHCSQYHKFFFFKLFIVPCTCRFVTKPYSSLVFKSVMAKK
jgi:hypothetical protein